MTTEAYPTLPIEPVPGAAAEPPRRRRLRWLWWLIGIVVVLAILVVVADVAIRAYAQGEAERQIESQLPAAVDGDVTVQIGGFSFLAQLAAGSFDEVTLDAPELSVQGVPLAAHVVATGVPTDLNKPIGDVQAVLSLDQAAVNSFVTLPGDAELALGDGEVSYEGAIDIFGLSIGYQATGQVTASGTDVTIQPTDAALTQGESVFDVSDLLAGLTRDPITLCVAQYLPQGARIDSLDLTPGEVTATLSAEDFVLSDDSLQNLGSCD